MSIAFLKELKLDALGGEGAYPLNGTPKPSPTGGPIKPGPKNPADAAASNQYFWEATFGVYRQRTTVKTRAVRRKILEKALPSLPGLAHKRTM